IARHAEGHYETAGAQAEYLLTLAAAQRGLGDVAAAQEALDRSGALGAERNVGELRVGVAQEQAELHAARGDYAGAFAAHKEFFAEYERLHSLQREAQARTPHALVADAQG